MSTVLYRLCIALLFFACTATGKETVQDAAIIARRLIDSPSSIGTLATIFPISSPSLSGEPYALQEYYSSCHSNGSLTFILMPISKHSQNILQSPTHSASLTVSSTPPSAGKPRVALMGNVTILDGVSSSIRDCYLQRHRDARWWLPEDPDAPHVAMWARFDPHDIYFVGGFGDRHYIGSIPLELYQNAATSGLRYQAIRYEQQL